MLRTLASLIPKFPGLYKKRGFTFEPLFQSMMVAMQTLSIDKHQYSPGQASDLTFNTFRNRCSH